MGSWPPRVMTVEQIWVVEIEYNVWQPFAPRIMRAFSTGADVKPGLERDWLRQVVSELLGRTAVALTDIEVSGMSCER